MLKTFCRIDPILLIPDSTDRIRYDSLDELLVVDMTQSGPALYGIDIDFLATVLRKCQAINEIYINFNKRYLDNDYDYATKYAIDGRLFDVIRASGLRLKKFTLCSDVCNVTEDQMKRFGQALANSVTELRFKYISDTKTKEVLLSDTFPKLEKLDFNSVERDLKEDMTKNVINRFPKLSHLKYTFAGFDGLRAVSDWLRITTLDIVLDAEECPSLCDSGVDRALALIAQLKSIRVFNVKIFTEDVDITAIDNGLLTIANSCPHLKRLDFIMDSIVMNGKLFDVFSRFRSLEFCEISIEFNEDIDDYGSLSSFQKCPHLRVFNLYLYNLSDQHLVDIDIHIPNITNFHLKSKTGALYSHTIFSRHYCHAFISKVDHYHEMRPLWYHTCRYYHWTERCKRDQIKKIPVYSPRKPHGPNF